MAIAIKIPNRDLKLALLSGAFVVGFLLSRATAADTTSPPLSPGHYMVTVMPPFNEDMGRRIQETLGKMSGLDSVHVKSGDSSIHFIIKKDAQVDPSQLGKVLQTVDAGAVMDTPVLEHTLSANPGL